MPTNTPTSRVVNLDDYDDPAAALDARFLGEFDADGFRASCSIRVPRARVDANLGGLTPDRIARATNRRVELYRGPGWVLRITVWSDGTGEVTAIATTDDAAQDLARQTAVAVNDDVLDPDTEPVAFWYANAANPRRIVRRVSAPNWPEIRRNYSAGVARQFDQLHVVTPDRMRGRLVVLHGPPGTGKTTALLTMAHAWRDWCSVEYVLDPERLLREPGYLMQVALREDDDDDTSEDQRGPWRLLILEDCDELIRADAKRGTGQSLARLLNLTDGVVGKGLRTLFCVTTNEDVGRLHAAITRPGRCLADIHVGRLGRTECAAWLGSDRDIPANGMTLAELDARAAGVADPTRAAPVGMYL